MSPTKKTATGEGDFDFQGAGAGVDSARDCYRGRPRGVHGVADPRRLSALRSALPIRTARTTTASPFNPKRLTYEVFGAPGTVADISYFDVNGDPKRVDGAHLPWSLKLETKAASVVGNLIRGAGQ